MKYLKTYETDYVPKKRRFWLINCKDEAYFISSLYHIKIKKDAIKNFLEIRDYIIKKYNDEKYYMTISGYMNFSEGYYWYIESGLKFMGEIAPTQKEIELAELELATKKYNL
jgi:hypothetical protein